jgi:hypothetical protein
VTGTSVLFVLERAATALHGPERRRPTPDLDLGGRVRVPSAPERRARRRAAADERAIAQFEQDWAAAKVTGDVAVLESNLAKEWTLTEDGQVTPRAQWRRPCRAT